MTETPGSPVADGLAAHGGLEPSGLAARPEVDPVVLAVIAAAVDQAWPRPTSVMAGVPPSGPVWRFSGRWWAKPVAQRRERPWARR